MDSLIINENKLKELIDKQLIKYDEPLQKLTILYKTRLLYIDNFINLKILDCNNNVSEVVKINNLLNLKKIIGQNGLKKIYINDLEIDF